MPLAQLAGQALAIDGYNILTTVEAALSGGFLLRGRDGCLRDLASVHGTYRKVAETLPALAILGGALAARAIGPCRWYLDQPVSNSGRLKAVLLALVARHGWEWDVELAFNPDKLLAASDRIVVTADSVILDRCARWTNLTGEIVPQTLRAARIIDLSGDGA